MNRSTRVLIAFALLALAFPAAFGVLLSAATAVLALVLSNLTAACTIAAAVLLASVLRHWRRSPFRRLTRSLHDAWSS